MASSVSIKGPRFVELRGRLFHDDDRGTPLKDIEVRLGADLFFQRDPFVDGKTDKQGIFSVKVDTRAINKNLYLDVISRPFEQQGEERVIVRLRFDDEVLGSKGNRPSVVDVGSRIVSFWDSQKPLALLKKPVTESMPQENSLEYQLHFLPTVVKFKLIQAGQYFNIKRDRVEAIQNAYSKNLTQVAEEQSPGITKTGYWMAGRMINGMGPSYFQKTKKADLKVKHSWNEFHFDAGKGDLPNVKIYLKKDESGYRVSDIKLQSRKTVNLNPNEIDDGEKNPPVEVNGVIDQTRLNSWVHVNENEINFKEAMFRARTALGAYAQISEHLGAGHLNVETYLLKIKKYLSPQNPVRQICEPHSVGTTFINQAGADVIFGENGALTKTLALTSKGVDESFLKRLAAMDWYWKPRIPLDENDSHAHIQQIYWGGVTKWVELYFSRNIEKITAHWDEIKEMSDAFVKESLPYQPLQGVARDKWIDLSEIDVSEEPRPVIDGVVKSMRPITVNDTPTPEDIERLKQFIRYFIMFATFKHSWAHNLQKADQGDKDYSVLGLATGTLAPSGEKLAIQLDLVNLLTAFKYGMLFATHESDNFVDPEFIAIVENLKSEFSKYGFIPEEFIRSSIMI